MEDRLLGYRDALERAGLSFQPEFVLHHVLHASDGASLVERLRHLEVTAVFAASESAALDLLRLCGLRGVAVPRQLAVAAFDDTPMAALASPPLTAVRQPTAEIGARATRLLLRLVSGEDVPPFAAGFAMMGLCR